MNVAHLDYESFSACDLKGCGSFRYAADPSTEILCIGLAWNDKEPVIWLAPHIGNDCPWYSLEEEKRANEILSMLSHPDTLVVSHNVLFEVALTDALFERTTGFKPPAHHQWRCTMAMARRAALPPSLEKCAEALGLPQKKDHRGKALIRKLCVPQEFVFKPTKPEKKEFEKRGITLVQAEQEARAAFKERITPADDPESFRELCDYCKQDTRVEREIHRKLKHFELNGFALESFQVDLEMNVTGFPVNVNALHLAKTMITEVVADSTPQFRHLTGINPTQGTAFREWLKQRGVDLPNLRSETLDDLVEQDDFDETSETGQAIMLHRKVSFAAIKKVNAMIKCHGPHDNHVRGTLTWHGTGPGRWGASLVQPHNFKKPSPKLIKGVNAKAAGFKDSDEMLEWLTAQAYKDLCEGCSVSHIEMVYGSFLEVLSSMIRHFIQDHRGPMCNADYSAIEARVLSWHAKEEWRMEVFRTHGKIYEASACQMFGLTMDQITKPLRQKGKVAELALGYQGGVGAMITMGALKEGLKEEELKPIVDKWREANPKIVKLWGDLDQAARMAITCPGRHFVVGHLAFFTAQTSGIPYLFLVLPSGRKIAYPRPRIEKTAMWKEKGIRIRKVCPTAADIARGKEKDPKGFWMPDGVTYWGEIKNEKGGKSTQWGRVSLSPGTMAENATMGSATDVMTVGLINAHKAGYRIYSMIHDEALSGYEPQKGQRAEEFCELLADLPSWADGLPVRADGGLVPFYKK